MSASPLAFFIVTPTPVKNDDIRKEFWALYQASKRKTTLGQRARAQEELLDFAKQHVPKTQAGRIEVFGKYADFAKSWADGELVTNRFGKKLYVKTSK